MSMDKTAGALLNLFLFAIDALEMLSGGLADATYRPCGLVATAKENVFFFSSWQSIASPFNCCMTIRGSTITATLLHNVRPPNTHHSLFF
jgi:hypothetical protein